MRPAVPLPEPDIWLSLEGLAEAAALLGAMIAEGDPMDPRREAEVELLKDTAGTLAKALDAHAAVITVADGENEAKVTCSLPPEPLVLELMANTLLNACVFSAEKRAAACDVTADVLVRARAALKALNTPGHVATRVCGADGTWTH